MQMRDVDRLTQVGRTRQFIEEDGDCMFGSVAHQLQIAFELGMQFDIADLPPTHFTPNGIRALHYQYMSNLGPADPAHLRPHELVSLATPGTWAVRAMNDTHMRLALLLEVNIVVVHTTRARDDHDHDFPFQLFQSDGELPTPDDYRIATLEELNMRIQLQAHPERTIWIERSGAHYHSLVRVEDVGDLTLIVDSAHSYIFVDDQEVTDATDINISEARAAVKAARHQQAAANIDTAEAKAAVNQQAAANTVVDQMGVDDLAATTTANDDRSSHQQQQQMQLQFASTLAGAVNADESFDQMSTDLSSSPPPPITVLILGMPLSTDTPSIPARLHALQARLSSLHAGSTITLCAAGCDRASYMTTPTSRHFSGNLDDVDFSSEFKAVHADLLPFRYILCDYYRIPMERMRTSYASLGRHHIKQLIHHGLMDESTRLMIPNYPAAAAGSAAAMSTDAVGSASAIPPAMPSVDSLRTAIGDPTRSFTLPASVAGATTCTVVCDDIADPMENPLFAATSEVDARLSITCTPDTNHQQILPFDDAAPFLQLHCAYAWI